MTKNILYATFLTALVALCCNDGGVQNKNPDVDGFMKLFSRENSPDNAYTLTTNAFPSNCGTVSRNPDKASYTFGELVTVTANPASGYIFTEWSGTATGKTNPIAITMDGNKALTAGFGLPGATRFTVFFNGNGKTDGAVPDAITADSGSVIMLPGQQTLEKNYYRFGGWNTKNDGTGTDYAANSSYAVNGNVTLYVRWIPVYVYTVTFNSNDGGIAPDAMSADSGSTITLPGQQTLEKSNFSFGGWNTKNNGTGTNYAANSSYAVNGNVTMYARWIPVYTVTFNSNDGGIAPDAMSADSGSTITLPGQGNMTKEGYNLGGWNANSSSTTISCPANSSYLVMSNITLYAVWTEITYTLTTNVSPSYGGSVSRNPNQISYTNGTSVTVTATATSGNEFTRWSGASTSTIASITITMDGNKTLTANFTSNGSNGYVDPSTVVKGTFTDNRNSTTYKTVKIGNQTWMAENLNYAISNTSTDSSWCYEYENSSYNCAKYGRFYNWSAATKICPAGWHLPSREEWGELAIAAGGTGTYGTSGTAGTKLKLTGGWGCWWASTSVPLGTDDYGFSALPGGAYYGGSFKNVGAYGYWWTATEDEGDYAYYRIMYCHGENVGEETYYKSSGYSVRCLSDD
jgi:uncharacterized protein (TIGR02145 family)